MKKLLLSIIMMFMPTVVLAATEINASDFVTARNNPEAFTTKGLKYTTTSHSKMCFDLSEGEYKFIEDINLGDDTLCFRSGDITLDLNEKTISSSSEDNELVVARDINLTIYGDGGLEALNQSIALYDGNLTIDGGTFSKEVKIKGASSILHIIDGTFNDNLIVEAKEVTIEDGTFNGTTDVATSDSIVIHDGSFIATGYGIGLNAISKSIIINNGEFEGYAGVIITDAVYVEINGGTYSGNLAGFAIDNTTNAGVLEEYPAKPDVIVRGGVFESSSDTYGAIFINIDPSVEDVINFISTWVPEGFRFVPEVECKVIGEDTHEIYIATQKQLEVEHIPYTVIAGDDQAIDLETNPTLSFEFSTLFSEFQESGEVYLDGELVDPENYTATEGSTIITFLTDFVKGLSNGDHEVTLATQYGDVTAVFNVTGSSDEEKKEEDKEIPDDKEDEKSPTDGGEKTTPSDKSSNPKTVDNIIYSMLTMFISWAAIMGIKLYKRN